MSKKVEQKRDNTKLIKASVNYLEACGFCPKCRAEQRQKLIEEIEPKILSLIQDLPTCVHIDYKSWWQQFKRGE
jgi:hypothetical protein